MNTKIVTLVILLAAVLLLNLNWMLNSTRSRSAFDERLYERVVERIRTGAIKDDGTGMVSLPQDMGATSVGGKVQVFKRPAGQMLVLFKARIGKGENMQGYLYLPEAVAKDEIKTSKGDPAVYLDGRGYVLGKRLGTDWYEVSFTLD